MPEMQTIELDCPPLTPRPDTYIEGVIEGTGLKAGDPIVTPFSFGNWTWEFDVPRDKWEKEIQPIIKPRIEALYHSGAIRYGSW